MTLDEILPESTSRHRHLCPRQVLGARMALCAAAILGLDLPRADKRLLVIAETDGCTVDGIIAATACRVGSRTLRILDFGKVAATFTDTHADTSIRIRPAHNARARRWVRPSCPQSLGGIVIRLSGDARGGIVRHPACAIGNIHRTDHQQSGQTGDL